MISEVVPAERTTFDAKSVKQKLPEDTETQRQTWFVTLENQCVNRRDKLYTRNQKAPNESIT